jgi:hypothetical protein
MLVAVPLAVILLWVAAALLARAYGLRLIRRARGQPTTKIVAADKTSPGLQSPDTASQDAASHDKPSQLNP